MEFLLTKIKENLNEQMLLLTISNPRKAEEIKKYNIRPVLVKDKLMFQSAAYTKTQVFHKNLKKNELVEELERLLPSYKQVQLQTVSSELTALINKKGTAAIKVKKQNNVVKAQMQMDKSHLLHNRTKKYILPEGTVVPFLKDLGVMTAEGKIVRTKYDKYRQINRFLEFIDMEHTPKNLLIRAIHRKKQSDKKKEKAAQQVDAFCKQFGFTPTLWKLLQEEGEEGGAHDE